MRFAQGCLLKIQSYGPFHESAVGSRRIKGAGRETSWMEGRIRFGKVEFEKAEGQNWIDIDSQTRANARRIVTSPSDVGNANFHRAAPSPAIVSSGIHLLALRHLDRSLIDRCEPVAAPAGVCVAR